MKKSAKKIIPCPCCEGTNISAKVHVGNVSFGSEIYYCKKSEKWSSGEKR